VQKRPCPPSRPPLIAFTATNDRDAAKAAGFAAHLLKPVDITRLVEAMSSALSGKDAKAVPAKA
jgi:AmiR/NasT family two-component response regulator